MVNHRTLSILQRVVEHLVTSERLKHIRNCERFSLILAERYGVDELACRIAALAHDMFAHDMFRDLSLSKLLLLAEIYGVELNDVEKENPILLHGKLAAIYLQKRFDIKEKSVLNAVRYHTSGSPELDTLGKIVFLADSLEFGRVYDKVETLRKLSFKNLDTAVFETLKNKMIYALKRNLLLLPESVEMWNSMIPAHRENSTL